MLQCPSPVSSPISDRILEALRQVIDPELGINVVDLGLIYSIATDRNHVQVEMTLTTPGCPLHDSITSAVEMAVNVLVPEVESVGVNLVWSPPWCPDRISAAGREELGWR